MTFPFFASKIKKFRHCERSEAISMPAALLRLLRYARNDELEWFNTNDRYSSLNRSCALPANMLGYQKRSWNLTDAASLHT
jgi:hypothetical protein